MRVFILGGTGSIGTELVKQLRSRSHEVIALSRSARSDEKLKKLGAIPFRGDMREPEGWVSETLKHDAVIQVAATFSDDMAEVDNRVTSALIDTSSELTEKRRILYTGGCWLYGETGDEVATEDRAFDPLPAFEWMVKNGERLLNCASFSTAIVHPALVYHEEGGAFERMMTAAREDQPIEVWGTPETRWAIIERSDLARAYCEFLDKPVLTGHFNAATQECVRVGDIANWLARRYDNTNPMIIRGADELVREYGSWAKGPTLDQQMSADKLMKLTDWRPQITDYRNLKLAAGSHYENISA
ncbi:NAD-dependent epimerase/dehydratase family protein [Pseudovibrio japonicus]|nr:NAD-dependent epimerase/dehydratase family protein [Pseudovibrio japonicus]